MIFVFILMSGFFAGAEIAVVTARKTLIDTLQRAGRAEAEALMMLKKNPERFLATIKIGTTMGLAMACVLGGAFAIEVVRPVISEAPVEYLAIFSGPLSILIVLVVVSYVHLLWGELIPKSLVLLNPERVALAISRLMYASSKWASVLINSLTGSANIILRPLGIKAFTGRGFVSQEEIKLLILEGKDRGIFESTEQELIHSVFEFTDISVKEVMVPIGQVVAISIDDPLERNLLLISEEKYSRYPVFSAEINNIKGILHAKDVFIYLAQHKEVNMRKLLRAPFFIPETMMISHLLSDMQKKRNHMAIVVNEHGMVTGIVTIEDLLEEIVGEIRDEHDTERPVISIGNGVYIVYASINIRDLKEDHAMELPESPQYDTLGGFIVTTLQKIPQGGETISLDHMRLTVLEMVNKRVSKVKVEFLNTDALDTHKEEGVE
ncbi:HlyC/CorC family transporter [Candidatus Magnetobacterium casensis]|uniref:HlyC/CorC family transporter n=1 Tax=Candidatus Magnetobacterium casense TaxID=1455061 RepID=A0ABS6RZ04_9BACT|nr:HlyC/CorC family transporter [Candidatus Magnetobacterium casensis]